MLVSEIQKILFDCIEFNCQFLKRRDVNITEIPVEFKVTELNKLIKNNTDTFPTPTIVNTNIYDPANITINAKGSSKVTPIVVTPIETPVLPPAPVLPPVVINPTPEPIIVQPAPVQNGGGGSIFNGQESMYYNNELAGRAFDLKAER
jgi:hypothetical protein